MRRIGLPA